MNWKNVNLKDGYEREQNFLDGYNFDVLLLEIQCNLKEINRQTVETQFLEVLNSRIDDAKEIFYNNINNIVAQAKKEREY